MQAVPSRRLVLLGASNLALALPLVAQLARAAWRAPLELMVAAGHGRSFGHPSTVVVRTFPGILQCGLWESLVDRPTLPSVAVITDVGNDILYEVPNDTIAAWVTTCIDNLSTNSERLVVTGLPLASLERLGKARFTMLRTLLFPRARISLDEALRRARDLDQRLAEITESRGFALCRPQPQWYGFDPIHIRRRRMVPAWTEILSLIGAPATREHPRISPWSQFRWSIFPPNERRIAGITQRRHQPCATFQDGTTLSLY